MNAPQEQPRTETISVENLHDFVRILTAWHGEQCAAVQQMLAVPEGATFQVGEEPEIVLTPASLAAFKLGVEMTMMKLGTLPFVAEIEELDTADAAG